MSPSSAFKLTHCSGCYFLQLLC